MIYPGGFMQNVESLVRQIRPQVRELVVNWSDANPSNFRSEDSVGSMQRHLSEILLACPSISALGDSTKRGTEGLHE